jgi:hypothetical protein
MQVIKEGEQVIRDIKPTRRSARVANIQADSVMSKETKSSTARGKHSASDELIPDLCINKGPQKKSTQQETKPFVNSVNPANPSTPVSVKQVPSNLVTDTPTIKPGTSTSAIVKEPSVPSKVSAEDYLSKKLFIQPTRKNDVVMIDLTQDSPKSLSKVASSAKNKLPVSTNTTKSPSPDSKRPGKLPRLIVPSPMANSPRVTFASPPHHHQNRVSHGPSGGLGSGGHAPSKRIEIGL